MDRFLVLIGWRADPETAGQRFEWSRHNITVLAVVVPAAGALMWGLGHVLR